MIREARPVDLDAIEKIYDNIHAAEESGRVKRSEEHTSELQSHA